MPAFRLPEYTVQTLARVAHAAHPQSAEVARLLLEHAQYAQMYAATSVSCAALLTLAQLLEVLPDEYRLHASLTREGFIHLRLSRPSFSTVIATLYPHGRVRYHIVDEPHRSGGQRESLSGLLCALESQGLLV